MVSKLLDKIGMKKVLQTIQNTIYVQVMKGKQALITQIFYGKLKPKIASKTIWQRSIN